MQLPLLVLVLEEHTMQCAIASTGARGVHYAAALASTGARGARYTAALASAGAKRAHYAVCHC